MSNLSTYKKDLENLMLKGYCLKDAFHFEILGREKFLEKLRINIPNKKEQEKFIAKLPKFNEKYQEWYSEAKVIIKLILPDRLEDFVKYYEVSSKRKNMKDIDGTNYVITDALNGLEIHRADYDKTLIAGKIYAFPKFEQQLAILKSINQRFESSLFDIKQLLKADLFDSELEASKHLNKNRFARAAGALAGVVLESHLSQVCQNHSLTITKRDPSISDYYTILYNNQVIDIQTFRKIQYLADIRNNCDHKKRQEPTKEDIDELIVGVEKIIKNLF
jgi:hypothetical protein